MIGPVEMVKRKRVILCRVNQEWVFKIIDKIVLSKQAMGIKTTFSYEIIRLAGNQLVKEMDGAEMDKRILREFK